MDCLSNWSSHLVIGFIPVRQAQIIVLYGQVKIWENELVLHSILECRL